MGSQQQQQQQKQAWQFRKRRRPLSFGNRRGHCWVLAMAAATTTTVLLTAGTGHCIDYSIYLQPLYGDNTNSNDAKENNRDTPGHKANKKANIVPDEAAAESSMQELYGSGSADAASWPSSRRARRPFSNNIDNDNDNQDAAIPKVVLRPRTRLNLEAAAAERGPMPVPSMTTSSSTTSTASGNGGSTIPNRRTTASAPVILPAAKATTTATPTTESFAHQEENTRLEILREEREFMDWCRNVLGIEASAVEIRTFEHELFQPTVPDWEDDLNLEITEDDATGDKNSSPQQGSTTNTPDGSKEASSTNKSTISIRGLAATRDIAEGESIIRIPVQALHSVATIMEQDPVLSQLLHTHRDWITPAEYDPDEPENENWQQQQYELPLLAIALLHHRRLGAASPVAPYVRILLRTPMDDMPFLWPAQRIRTLKEGVRIVARGVREEMQTMYQTVVLTLIDEFPDLLGPEYAVDEHGVWMFSYDMFQWAFAMVNSRHWQLPVPDLAPAVAPPTKPNSSTASSVEDPMPPASVPTESWVHEHGDVDDDVAVHNNNDSNNNPDDNVDPDHTNTHSRKTTASSLSAVHSFLAPVADLLNFGYPCTHVQYNAAHRVFEVVATCAFHAGDEITFWYSNECDDVMMGVYGFAHALVPPCRTSEEWRRHATDLEEQLQEAYQDLEWLEDQLEYVEAVLADCDCCSDEQDGEPRLRHEQKQEPRRSSGRAWRPSSTGGSHKNDDINKYANSNKNNRGHRIRRTWSRKSEF